MFNPDNVNPAIVDTMKRAFDQAMRHTENIARIVKTADPETEEDAIEITQTLAEEGVKLAACMAALYTMGQIGVQLAAQDLDTVKNAVDALSTDTGN